MKLKPQILKTMHSVCASSFAIDFVEHVFITTEVNNVRAN